MLAAHEVSQHVDLGDGAYQLGAVDYGQLRDAVSLHPRDDVADSVVGRGGDDLVALALEQVGDLRLADDRVGLRASEDRRDRLVAPGDGVAQLLAGGAGRGGLLQSVGALLGGVAVVVGVAVQFGLPLRLEVIRQAVRPARLPDYSRADLRLSNSRKGILTIPPQLIHIVLMARG